MAISRVCSIAGCDKPVWARRWCSAHYQRWSNHGDPLSGGPPRGTTVGSPERFYREVVLPYDGLDCLLWPFARDANGYAIIKNDRASRIVCEEIHGPAPTPKHESAHSCGKGHLGCVAKRHLDWKTPKENAADKLIHDTHIRGERHPLAKLTPANVNEIRRLRGVVFQYDLADRFGVAQSLISVIQTGKKWTWL